MQNLSKSHEKNVQTAVNGEQVSNILDNVENVPFALKGSTVKSILYWLFCFIAALELSAALFFYFASLGAPQAVAATGAVVLGCAIHFLLHSLLSITTHGMVFSKKRESQAMSNEVKTNIVLSIVLLATVALIVFFVGKKGFSSYRATKYETAQKEAKQATGEAKGIDASMLTNKSGKIAAWKLEALTDLEKAKSKGVEATTAAVAADREAYDNTTAQMTDIVGVSAFILELLLALLAYSIATAKFAAVYDEIARRNGASRPTSQQAQQSTPTTANNAPSVPTNSTTSQQASPTAAQQPQQAATATEPQRTGVTKRFNEYSHGDQISIMNALKKDLERDMFYFTTSQCYEYMNRVNMLITAITENNEVTIKFHSPIVTDDITTAPIEPPTAAPIQQKQIGFSDNRTAKNTAQTAVTTAVTPNEGRVIIKGFQRHNGEKTDKMTAVTAAVTTAVTDTKKGICKRCENEYEKTVYNKKFCCEDCKILYWQEKTARFYAKERRKKFSRNG